MLRDKTEKAKWQTNCSFAYENDTNRRYNIQTISDINQIVDMTAFLVQKMEYACKAGAILGVEVKFEWMGFTFDEWMSDFKTRIEKIQITVKKNELKELEGRLDKLVSKERREEMEIQAIKQSLGL